MEILNLALKMNTLINNLLTFSKGNKVDLMKGENDKAIKEIFSNLHSTVILEYAQSVQNEKI